MKTARAVDPHRVRDATQVLEEWQVSEGERILTDIAHGTRRADLIAAREERNREAYRWQDNPEMWGRTDAGAIIAALERSRLLPLAIELNACLVHGAEKGQHCWSGTANGVCMPRVLAAMRYRLEGER